MMKRSIRGAVAAGAFAVAVPFATSSSAQYANEPFFEWTVVMSQAFGLEMAQIRVNVLDAIEGEVDPDLIEVVEQMAKGDWERFGGTLTERDPALAGELYEHLAAFEELLEEGESADYLIEPTRALLAQAYDLVIDPAIRETAAFKGGVMAQLLLAEGGVAEGFEEAAEEIFAFSMGWGSLQRVKELWADVQGPATDDQKDEANQLLTILDTLYPTVNPPDPFVGFNPEEAEAPSQLFLGIIESATDASLYSGRDLARLSGHLVEVLTPACGQVEAGQIDLAKESFYATADHFLGETTGLADLLNLFAPELYEEAEAIFPHFVLLEEEEEGEEDESAGAAPAGAPAAEEEDEEEIEFETPLDACNAMIEVLTEARTVLGG
ncbi:MAG: hypothetical protein AB7O56_11875 [Bauldia sp.]